MGINPSQKAYENAPKLEKESMLNPIKKELDSGSNSSSSIGKALEANANKIRESIKDNIQVAKSGSAKSTIDFDDISLFEKMFSPSSVVEKIRNSKGQDRNEQLLNFESKISKMNNAELKEMRNYIVNEMASPKNKDDELLGSLLNTVNKKLDSKNSPMKKLSDLDELKPVRPIHITPFPHTPKPIICPPLNTFDKKNEFVNELREMSGVDNKNNKFMEELKKTASEVKNKNN